ncbi:MAG: DUF393 domain-containing protein [Gammaproteobacteria bacterium]|nr:DUF393 domain-containing protein [Gammaproteobacteria bacterium]
MTVQNNLKLTIFYDSQCPLCLAEMQQLKKLDKTGSLGFANLHDADFEERYPHIDKVYANRILHGQLDTGEILLGLDVTCKAWSLAGKHRWLAILRWPVIRILADSIYLLFARHRYRISYWLTGKPRCNTCMLDSSLKP